MCLSGHVCLMIWYGIALRCAALHTAPQISMHMFYRDMRRVGLSDPRACLSFKIDHALGMDVCVCV